MRAVVKWLCNWFCVETDHAQWWRKEAARLQGQIDALSSNGASAKFVNAAVEELYTAGCTMRELIETMKRVLKAELQTAITVVPRPESFESQTASLRVDGAWLVSKGFDPADDDGESIYKLGDVLVIAVSAGGMVSLDDNEGGSYCIRQEATRGYILELLSVLGQVTE